MLPDDEQLPQRLAASPTLTDRAETPAAAANSATSRDIVVSACCRRNRSTRRGTASTGPPHRNSSPLSIGVRGALCDQMIPVSLPSIGIEAPGTSGSPGCARASCASIQSCWSSAH
jgi:hypothetical protein